MRRAFIAILLSVASLSLIAAGCGGGDDETTPATTEEAAEETTEEAETGGQGGGAETLEVSMGEYFFEPSEPTVPEGGTLDVVNDGEIVHNLTVEDTDVATADLQSGESEEVAVDLGPGEYPFICTIPGHAEQGMTGTLTVE